MVKYRIFCGMCDKPIESGFDITIGEHGYLDFSMVFCSTEACGEADGPSEFYLVIEAP